MKEKLKPYLQALPDIFIYQIVTKIILGIWLFLLGRIFQVLLKSSGRVAVTSGDWLFLFASVGKTAKLNCDYIGFEEESATADAIRNVHDEGKKVLVWTANEKESQKHFLCTEADGIITDNVSQAVKIAKELENRSDLDRMVDKIRTIM